LSSRSRSWGVTVGERGAPLGVVLLNMGGPERLEDVAPFLMNLFSDREIIRLSPFPFLQRFIAARIVKKRAPKSREAYRLIGGGSPLARITREQARALAESLGGGTVVLPAMRYWHPYAHETVEALGRAGVRRVVLLPLYPHFSRATTGSSLKDFFRAQEALQPAMETAVIDAWPDDPEYVGALAETIMEGVGGLEAGSYELVYSAHSLPKSFIDQGDPYLDHLKRTIQAVEAATGIIGRLCFQSRSGPVKWLTPSTPDLLDQLAREGVRRVVMVPLSFVSDHVETLYEIDILYKTFCRERGLELVRTPSLNTRPRFIGALARLVREAWRTQGWTA